MFTISIKKIETLDSLKNLRVDNILINDQKFGMGQTGFSCEEIVSCIKKAHLLGFKVWVKVDKLYEEDELEALEEYLNFLVDNNADAVWYTDMAVKVLLEKKNIALVYAPETLLTNKYDVACCLKEANYCVISKDIPLENILAIVDENDNCFIRIHGEILISYSKRRFISSYLDKYDEEYTDNYYLKEENRDEYLPIIERKDGSWLYGFTLVSYHEIKDLSKHNFKGFIIDNIFESDDRTIKVVRDYNDILDDKQVEIEKDGKITYLNISDIKETERLK